MKDIVFKTHGTCAKQINFSLDENNRIHNLTFQGGCDGNLKAIGKLTEGLDAADIADILAGNTCGGRPTSCADQLSKAIREAINA